MKTPIDVRHIRRWWTIAQPRDIPLNPPPQSFNQTYSTEKSELKNYSLENLSKTEE